MFPMMPSQGNNEEKKILKLFKSLGESDRQTLLAFAEFLSSKNNDDKKDDKGAELTVPTVPLGLPRPDNESVIKAIKRLTENYPMIDKETILHPISGLMTSHIMQGRNAVEVIDDLEALFLSEFQKLEDDIKADIKRSES